MTPYNVHAKEPFNQHRIIATGSRVDCTDELLAQFHQFDRYAADGRAGDAAGERRHRQAGRRGDGGDCRLIYVACGIAIQVRSAMLRRHASANATSRAPAEKSHANGASATTWRRNCSHPAR